MDWTWCFYFLNLKNTSKTLKNTLKYLKKHSKSLKNTQKHHKMPQIFAIFAGCRDCFGRRSDRFLARPLDAALSVGGENEPKTAVFSGFWRDFTLKMRFLGMKMRFFWSFYLGNAF
jgi:hypothetical protein